MEAVMREQIDKYMDVNEKLKDVFRSHQSYGKKIAKMEKKKILSSDDTIELKSLKKMKLQKKDEMETILREEHDFS